MKNVERPEDVCEEAWDEWVEHRRKKKASVTERLLRTWRTAAAAAGMTLEEAMDWSVAQNHQGFYPQKQVRPQAAARPQPGSYGERMENQRIVAGVLTGTYRPAVRTIVDDINTLEHDDGTAS